MSLTVRRPAVTSCGRNSRGALSASAYQLKSGILRVAVIHVMVVVDVRVAVAIADDYRAHG